MSRENILLVFFVKLFYMFNLCDFFVFGQQVASEIFSMILQAGYGVVFNTFDPKDSRF